jgi:hypothetical protein
MIMGKGMDDMESYLGFPCSTKDMEDACGQVNHVRLMFTQESEVEESRETFHHCNKE